MPRATRISPLSRAVMCTLSLLALTTTLAAQRSALAGSVRDDRGEPVVGARVTVRGIKTAALTDGAGHFSVADVQLGLTYITIRAPGAYPEVDILTFTAADSLNFTLRMVGERDDSVTAIREAEKEFTRIVQRYARATTSSRSARAFTARDIARRSPAVTTDLFEGVVGFILGGTGSSGQVFSTRDGCAATVFVNETERPNFSLNEIRPSEIKLLLAYNGYAAIPATLRSVRVEPTCGVIAVLTR